MCYNTTLENSLKFDGRRTWTFNSPRPCLRSPWPSRPLGSFSPRLRHRSLSADIWRWTPPWPGRHFASWSSGLTPPSRPRRHSPDSGDGETRARASPGMLCAGRGQRRSRCREWVSASAWCSGGSVASVTSGYVCGIVLRVLLRLLASYDRCGFGARLPLSLFIRLIKDYIIGLLLNAWFDYSIGIVTLISSP